MSPADARRSRSGRRSCSGASTRSFARRTSSSTCWRSSIAAERAGATVETTLDCPLQQRLEIAVRDHLEAVGGRGISQAGVVVIRNSDGAVLAMVGSRDYFDARHAGAVNVTTIRRRPGSTLKPFVYGLALEAGDSPATLAYDVVLPGETRETYTAEVKQHGVARYRESLAGSYNLAAVHTLARVGPPALVERLRRAGLTTLRCAGRDVPAVARDRRGRVPHHRIRGRVRGVRQRGPRGGAARDHAACACPAARSDEPAIAAVDAGVLAGGRVPDLRHPRGSRRAAADVRQQRADECSTSRSRSRPGRRAPTPTIWRSARPPNTRSAPGPATSTAARRRASWRCRARRRWCASAFVALAARFGPPTAPARPPALERGAVCALSGMLPGPDCPHKHETFAAGTRPRQLCTWHRRAVRPPRGEVSARGRRAGRASTGWFLRAPSTAPRSTEAAARVAALAITYPADGARFVLDPERPPTQQQPPLRAIPAQASVRWTVDGVAADRFVPSPGTHLVRASLGGLAREITISFE